eukprot:jgi/Hompol1/5171/HPOL_004199-RA
MVDSDPPTQAASGVDLDLVKLGELASMAVTGPLASILDQGVQQIKIEPPAASIELSDLFNCEIVNPSAQAIQLEVAGASYIVPQECSFAISDLGWLPKLCKYWEKQQRQFGLIIMDPPWPNKSIERSGAYNTLEWSQLSKLPLKRLIAPDGIVAVWVTNKAKVHDFVLNKLFPAWNVEQVSEWVWLKITREGEPYSSQAIRVSADWTEEKQTGQRAH